MIKDGRRYLVHCTWPTQSYWEIVRWGAPAGLSDPNGVDGWIVNSGFKIRTDNCVFGEFFELDVVITTMQRTPTTTV